MSLIIMHGQIKRCLHGQLIRNNHWHDC